MTIRWRKTSALVVWCWAVVMFAAVVRPAEAQLVTVQQPVVQRFSASTVVTVPDRGEMFLGGVGQAAASRTMSRPYSGSSVGAEMTSSSVSARVWIHDLPAMDEATLAAAATRSSTSARFSQPRQDTGRFTRQADLLREQSLRSGVVRSRGNEASDFGGADVLGDGERRPAVSTAETGSSSPTRKLAPGGRSAEEYLGLAERAEQRGKPKLAALYRQLAGKLRDSTVRVTASGSR
jgi:hypothetical protein